jgi:hypothetical protein
MRFLDHAADTPLHGPPEGGHQASGPPEGAHHSWFQNLVEFAARTRQRFLKPAVGCANTKSA